MIVNAKGLHARAAAKLAKLAATFKADITVTRGDTTVSARSIMGLMMLAAAKGSTIDIAARGPDAEAALAAAAALVAGGFGEN
ncbi:MAG: HPr family phosphocarrier protein [Alphaproteobacteria bacterium]